MTKYIIGWLDSQGHEHSENIEALEPWDAIEQIYQRPGFTSISYLYEDIDVLGIVAA